MSVLISAIAILNDHAYLDLNDDGKMQFVCLSEDNLFPRNTYPSSIWRQDTSYTLLYRK